MLHCQFLCHVLKALFFTKIALKLCYFCKKTQDFRALGAPPPNPRASGGWGLCPHTPSLRWLGASPQDPHWEFLATRLDSLTIVKHLIQERHNVTREGSWTQIMRSGSSWKLFHSLKRYTVGQWLKTFFRILNCLLWHEVSFLLYIKYFKPLFTNFTKSSPPTQFSHATSRKFDFSCLWCTPVTICMLKHF